MNANDTFDRDMGRWLEVEGTAHAPVGLHAAVVDRARALRQRPGWLVRDRGPSTRATDRAPRRRWLLALAVLAVGTGVVGASLGGGGHVAPVPSSTSVTTSATAVPTSATAVPTVGPAPVMAYIDVRPHGMVGYSRIWLLGTDGSGSHELFPGGDTDQTGVAWSPDGTRLIFSESPYGPDARRLYLTDAAGSRPQVVDTGCVAPCRSDFSPAFSQDGSRLVFERSVEGASPVITTLDLGTGQVVELRPTLTISHERPRWSPDNRQIIFSTNLKFVSPDLGHGPAVFIVDADGSNMRMISLPSLPAGFPDWSPDGTRIVFTSYQTEIVGEGENRRENEYQDIYTVRPDWTDLRRLTTDGMSMGASWTSDGRILFRRLVVNIGMGFWTMDADGNNASLLAAGLPTALNTPASVVDAAWQPTP